MKRFIYFLPVVVVLVAGLLILRAPKAEAQFFGGIYGSQPINIPANLTNGTAYAFSFSPGFDCRNAKTISIQFSGACSNTASSNVKVVLFPSLNGTTVDTTTTMVLTVPLSGTAQCTLSTNFTLNATGFIVSGYVTNGDAYFSTNSTLLFSLKPGY